MPRGSRADVTAQETDALGPDSRPAIAVALSTAAYVAISLYVSPALAVAYVGQLGFRPDQPGYVISAEMAGMGLATFPAFWWVERVDARRVARIMLVALMAGNLLSIWATTPASLGGVRFVTGLAQGTLSIVCMTSLRLTRDPNRSFALWLFAQLLAGAIALAMLPGLLQRAGIQGFFAVLAVFAAALVWQSRHRYSAARPSSVAAPNAQQNSVSAAGICGLAGLLAFYVSFSSLWAFVAQIAHASSIEPEYVGYALSLAPVGGMLGAAVAAGLGMRLGSAGPLAAGVAILGCAIWILGSNPRLSWYLPAAVGLMFAWTFTVPYFIGGLAAIDRSGRITVAVNFIIGAGLAVGPALGGFVLAHWGHYDNVALLGIALCIASFLLAIPCCARRELRARSEVP